MKNGGAHRQPHFSSSLATLSLLRLTSSPVAAPTPPPAVELVPHSRSPTPQRHAPLHCLLHGSLLTRSGSGTTKHEAAVGANTNTTRHNLLDPILSRVVCIATGAERIPRCRSGRHRWRLVRAGVRSSRLNSALRVAMSRMMDEFLCHRV